MFRNKRQGVELAVNTVIIFALVVLVLLVLAFILLGGFSNWNKGTSCSAQGGECEAVDKACPEGLTVTMYSCGEKEKCCAKSIAG